MRLCLDRLSKNEMHGQKPIVTLPTKQALNQFEAQQKTRPLPPSSNAPRGQAPMQGPMSGGNFNGPPGPQGHPPRMIMPNGPGPGYRPQHMPPQNMQQMGPNQCPPRMQVSIHIMFQFIFYFVENIFYHHLVNIIFQKLFIYQNNNNKKENNNNQKFPKIKFFFSLIC